MRRSHYLVIILLLICQTSFGQIYQNMAQPGYKFSRARFDSVLSIPIGLGNLKNISGGQDTGQIRFNKSDSSVYVWNGRAWIKAGGGTIPTLTQVLESAAGANEAGANQIKDLAAGTSTNDAATFGQLTDTANLRLRISDTASMLSNYAKTAAVALKLNIADTATMLAPYSRVTVSSYGKNATADSTILLLSNGTRYAAKDSIGGGGASGWSLTGNAGTVDGTNFLGNTDSVAFSIRTNNTTKIKINKQTATENQPTVVIQNGNSTNGTGLGIRFTEATTPYLNIKASNNGTSFELKNNSFVTQRNYLALNNDGSVAVNSQAQNTGLAKFSVYVNSANTNGDGIFIYDSTNLTTTKSAFNFYAGNTRLLSRIASTVGSGYTDPTMYFEIATSGVMGEAARITSRKNFMIGTQTEATSAILNVGSTTQGVLFPRMTLTQRNAIASPAAGLQVVVTGETGGEFVSMWNSTAAAWVNATSKWSTNANGINYNGGRVGIGTATPANTLDVAGTARIALNQNETTSLNIANTTNGTVSNVSLILTSNSSAGSAQVFKMAQLRTAYKTLEASDFGHYNATAGDISFLNDVALGKIKFTAGAASTSQMTLTAAGRLLLGTTTENTSAALNISSTSSGLLIPRMNVGQRDAISSPAIGLQIYHIDQQRVNFYDGTAWRYSPTAFTGTAAPTTTPIVVGDTFTDVTNKKMYVATGISTSADWTILN